MKKKSFNLDQLAINNLVELFLSEEENTIRKIQTQKANITKAISLIVKNVGNGGRVIYLGAGTSGRLAVLDAVECIPTFNSRSFLPVIAGGKKAVFKAQEGAEDNKQQAIKDLKNIRLKKHDVVVGISASGETPYTVSGVGFAKKNKIATIGITSNPISSLAKQALYKITPNVGSEIIEGSSRLKSGTAQKIVLNMLSSISMIKSGKVFNNLMIDVQPTNKKLIRRAVGIISTICKLPCNKAEKLFLKSKKNTKVAILMYFKRCDLKTARNLLLRANFDLRKIIN